MHLMKNAKHLFGAAAILCACANAHAQFGGIKLPSLGGSPIDLTKTVNSLSKLGDIDEAHEIEIGQNYASILLGAKPLLRDEHVQRYVNTLGRWLALQSERPDLPWTFAVIDDSGFNAFATPGGYVFVTRGLLERMQNESELAGVLGHEIGHVLRKHYLKSVKKSAVLSLVTDNVNTGSSQLKTALLNLFKDTYTKGLDQEDEYEADRVGVVIAARAGYDPFGLPAVLQILQEQSGKDNNFSLMLSTHPAPGDRLDRLDRLMKNQFDNSSGVAGPSLAQRIREF
jgi:predicted Zn-dependent protease